MGHEKRNLKNVSQSREDIELLEAAEKAKGVLEEIQKRREKREEYELRITARQIAPA